MTSDVGSAWACGSCATLAGLADEVGLPRGAAGLVPAAIALLSCSTATPVVLCGLTLPMKALYAAVSVAACIQCSTLSKLSRSARDRTIYRRGLCAMTVCGAVHLFLAVAGSTPDFWAYYFSHGPEVAFHYMQDFVVNPMLILNMATLAEFEEMRFCSVGLGVVGTSLNMMASTVPLLSQQLACTILGAVAYSASVALTGHLPNMARRISHERARRCQRCLDAITFAWPMYPVAQYLGYVDILTGSQVAAAFAALDLVGKCFAVQLLFEGRPLDELRLELVEEPIPLELLLLDELAEILDEPRGELAEPAPEPGTYSERVMRGEELSHLEEDDIPP